VRRVHYRWHPLYGKDVVVRGKKDGMRGVLRCQVDDDDKRDNREVPVWMFDRVRCELAEITARPHVSWDALLDLRWLLDNAGETVACNAARDGSPSKTEETHAAEEEAIKSKPSDRAVRCPQGTAALGRIPGRDKADGDRAGGSHAAAAATSRSSNCGDSA
jgi:hypothetical protein